jgi:Protein of unknown function (DUF3800)
MDKQLPEFSDYIVFVDESGSPTMSPIDPEYPIFVLTFCVFNKASYVDLIQPAVKRLKFDFFGHDMTVLHSIDIRKRRGEFEMLMNSRVREAFLQRVEDIVKLAEVDVISHVIEKMRYDHPNRDHPRNDPYHIALRRCILSLGRLLKSRGQHEKLTHIIAESRGKSEDQRLLREFEWFKSELCASKWKSEAWDGMSEVPLLLKFAEKKINSAGLQIADLTSHPIGRNAIKPDQPNRAFDIVKTKVFEEIGRFP